jgi:hypothetical protein
MLELDASPFYQITSILNGLKGVIDANLSERNDLVPEETRIAIMKDASLLSQHLKILNANVTMHAHLDVLHALTLNDLQWAQLGNVLETLMKILTYEFEPPPLKWSTVSYVFCSKEDRDAKEAVQAGRDCREAAAG